MMMSKITLPSNVKKLLFSPSPRGTNEYLLRGRLTYFLLWSMLLFHLCLVGAHIWAGGLEAAATVEWSSWVKTIGLSLARLSFWGFLVILILRIPRSDNALRLTTVVIGIFIGFCFIVELHTLRSYASYFNHTIASIVANSNLSESKEFFQSTLSWQDFTWGLSLLLVSFGGAYILSSIFSLSTYKSLHQVRSWVWATLMLLVGVPSHTTLYAKAQKGYLVYTTLSSYDRLIWSNYSVWAEGQTLERYMQEMEESIGAVSPTTLEGQHNVVLIIGESLRRDYMSCYGYELPNTPRLDSLSAKGDLVLFTNVTSPASSTVLSLTHTLSTKTAQDTEQWYRYPFINLILRKAGYRTSWLSNQESSGFVLKSLNAIAALSDTTLYAVRRSYDDDRDVIARHYDGLLLPIIDKLIPNRQLGQNHFDVFHLMGNHFTYSSRFPESYAKFKAEDIKRDLKPEQKQIVADYVNSIYYNDFVVSEIIKRYHNTPTMVIYLSDHGQILYDDPKRPDFVGHGGAVMPQGLRIPLMVYFSPSFRERYPEVVAQVERSKDRRIVTDILPYAVSDLLGVKGQFSNKSLSFFSDEYNENRQTVVISNDKLLELFGND